MKRSKKRASMHPDVTVVYVSGWGGKINRMSRRIERAVRKRTTNKIIEEER